MNFEKKSINLLQSALDALDLKFSLPIPRHDHSSEEMMAVLSEVADRMANNYPYFHPLYAGQMLKPPHPIARAAYQLAMWINPNNHALDGSRASSPMEKEVVADLARMFGLADHLGHLTSGGTMANLEALWVSGQENPGKKILASDQAHYTHGRISEVLKLPFESVNSHPDGRMDLNDLENKLQNGDIGTIVVTMGTTGLGQVDPLKEVLELQKQYSFRIHADAAYGGYFRLADNLSEYTKENYRLLDKVDSIVIDPHKHGLQPYGCGCVLFKDPQVARHYIHDSPYTYFTSDELHLGEISLECSRAGASAVGLWATHQLLPPVEKGKFASELEKCCEAAVQFSQRVSEDDRFYLVSKPELDIVVWAVQAESTDEMSQAANDLFERAAAQDLHLSKLQLPASKLGMEGGAVTCLRTCLMKPEHLEWLDEIWKRLE